MTEDKTTITSNEEIARFMGARVNNHWVAVPGGSGEFASDILSFHKDWNELMKVVEKIESLGFATTIYSGGCQVFLRGQAHGMLHDADTKIESVYNCVLEFVRWHNSQSKP